jgi:nitrite reductase (NADH) large subunit
MLWEFIAGQVEEDAVFHRPLSWYDQHDIELHLGTAVTALDPRSHQLTLADGTTVTYDRVLLATGARPFVPSCMGAEQAGVFTLRTLDDALAIKAYATLVPSATVIGGGLLGLETARALHTAGLDVTVIEYFPYLLPRQMDVEGAQVLQSLLERQGLRVLTGGQTNQIVGAGRCTGVRLEDGRAVEGELVIFSTGIRSETSLAVTAGINTNRGVIVDERLQSIAADVFAVGDVAEFEGRVYGIIPPAIEQARIAAANMVELGSAAYRGTLPSTTLKVAGAELTSLGQSLESEDSYTVLRSVDLAAGHYRKLVLSEGRLIGAILLNERNAVRPVTQLIERGVDVSAHVDQLLNADFDLKSLLG